MRQFLHCYATLLTTPKLCIVEMSLVLLSDLVQKGHMEYVHAEPAVNDPFVERIWC